MPIVGRHGQYCFRDFDIGSGGYTLTDINSHHTQTLVTTLPAGSQLYTHGVTNGVTNDRLYRIHAAIVTGSDDAEGHTYIPLTLSGAAVCVTVWLCNTVVFVSC